MNRNGHVVWRELGVEIPDALPGDVCHHLQSFAGLFPKMDRRSSFTPASHPALAGPLALCLIALMLAAQAVSGQSYGLDSRPVIGPFLNNALPPIDQSGPQNWSVVEAFPNLSVDDPVCMVPDPRSTRIYVCGRQGTIHFFTNSAAVSTKTLFLDLTPVTQGYDDCGLIGFTLHPEFGVTNSPNRGYVYVYYQYSPSPVAGPNRPPSATAGYNRLSRFTVPDGSLIANRNSEMVMINQYDRHVWHNGGGMFFGTDGFLYLSNGDEGAANDSYNQTQKISAGLFSGALRIDVDMNATRSHPIRRQPLNPATPPNGWPNSFTTNYFIPNDNPWISQSGTNLEEFFAIGLRSPHRMTLDPPTGRIWLGDVGQGTWEEVDIIVKGGNYQWAYREGDHAGPKAKPASILGTDRPPVYDYAHASNNNCVIGGYVYRGSEHAGALGGKYIFGDNGSGRIWMLSYDGVNPTTVTYLANMPSGANYSGLSSFGLDQNNELFMLKMGRPSKIYKLARASTGPPPPPPLLSQLGAFTNLATLAPAAALIPFTVNSPLWSDNAVKSRWMAVPNNGAPYGANETIGFSPTNPWAFPTGSVFVKHFELPVNDTNGAIRKRLETRFLVRATNGGFYGLTYKWRADNSDADLLPDSLSETNLITTATGVRTQVWYYPSRVDCLACHTANAGSVLGPRTCQLNGDFTYAATGRTDNQLRTLNALGLFNPPLIETNIPGYQRTVAITNTTATLEHRVRSYLDANCAHCHRPNGVQAYFDARFETPLESQNIVNGPVGNALGIIGAREVAPQSLAQSIMHLRMNSLDTIKMPPLAKNMIDNPAVAVLADWINSLPPAAGLPPPWLHQDIGTVGVAGDATHSTGVFSVTGSGADIWNNTDAFHFMHQPLNGNGTITARVTAIGNTDPWAKAGVMIRETLTAGSTHAMTVISPANGIAFQRRVTTGGTSTTSAGPLVAAPYWLRLTRTNNTFIGYQSSNGVTWIAVGTNAITMTSNVFVGIAVTAHNNALANTATFTDVTVTGPNVNTPPRLSSIANQTIAEDASTGPISFTVQDSETAAASLVVTAASSSPALAPLSRITFGGSGTNRTITVLPATNQAGTATITVTLSDGAASTNTSFLFTVNPVNDAPVAMADTIHRTPGRSVKVEATKLLLNDSDVDGGALSLSAAGPTSTAGGTAGLLGRWVRYVPPPGLATTDTFSYTAGDGLGGTSTAIITVQPTNDVAATANLVKTDLGNGSFQLRAQGIPGLAYRLQYSESLLTPVWQSLSTNTAGANGALSHLDTPPLGAPARFYRAISP